MIKQDKNKELKNLLDEIGWCPMCNEITLNSEKYCCEECERKAKLPAFW